VLAPLDKPLLDAFGYRRPGAPMRWLSSALLKGAAWRRRLAAPATAPQYHEEPIRSYPDGYRVQALGAGPPPVDIDPAWLAR
jgi:hypothetical protein